MNWCSTAALEDQPSGNHRSSAQLDHVLSTYPLELVAIAQNRVQYLKEIDRRQPIAITSKTMEPLIQSVSERIKDAKPPGWRTLWPGLRQMAACGPRHPRRYLAARR